jgi:CHAT domain-containing protein
MCKKSLGFWYFIRLIVKSASLRVYRRILRLVFLTILGLVTTLSVPVLPEQGFAGSNYAIAQATNAQTLLQKGIDFYNSERFNEAVRVFKQALANSQGDQLNQALILRYLSLTYQHLGQWQEAEKAIAQSLKLLGQNTTHSQNYLDVLAKTLNTQGRLQSTKGEWSEALETWKKAAATYKQSGNNTGMIGSLINQAEALQALGLSSQAELQLHSVEQILQQLPDPTVKLTGLQSLGKAHRRVGNLSKSSQVLLKSLAVARAFKLSWAESSTLLELGNTELALGHQAKAIGKQEDATKHIQCAIAFYQQAANLPTSQLQAQLNLLTLLVETAKSSEATTLIPKIQRSLTSLPPSQTSIYAQLNFARSLTKLGNREGSSFSNIAQILANAVQQARNLQDKAAESYALGQLGELYELTKQYAIAEDLTQQALLLAEEMQNPDLRYRWEWQLGRLWENQGQRKQAIAAYTDAVAALKSIKSDLLSINADVQFSFRDNVEPIYRKLVDLLLATEGNIQPTPENLQQATETIDSLRLAELENFLRCNLSLIKNKDAKTEDINKIDQIDKKAAFIYPIILEDRIEIIFKLPGQDFKHYVTSIKQSEVEKTTLELRAKILKRNYPEAVIEKATQLYQWLISPLEQDLEKHKEIQTLVFVLDGALRNIPISVLYDSKRQEYLMQKQYAIALVPDLQLFDLRPLKREQLKVLTAGVSDKKEIDGRLFDALPNVPEELKQIGSAVPAKPLLNPSFTKVNLEQQINSGTFSTIHIATHGQFSSDPNETYILTYDKLLKSNDLNNLLRGSNENTRRSIELLVLSACETAQGDNRATLGLAGIAVRAGARSTLATLWQVSDRSTAEVMAQFYKELTNPQLTKAEALHQAQLALFKRYQNPYNWAAYVLVGNWL